MDSDEAFISSEQHKHRAAALETSAACSNHHPSSYSTVSNQPIQSRPHLQTRWNIQTHTLTVYTHAHKESVLEFTCKLDCSSESLVPTVWASVCRHFEDDLVERTWVYIYQIKNISLWICVLINAIMIFQTRAIRDKVSHPPQLVMQIGPVCSLEENHTDVF